MNFKIKSFHYLSLFVLTGITISSCSSDFFSQEIDNNLPTEPEAVLQLQVNRSSNTADLLLSESLPIYAGWVPIDLSDRITFISNAAISLQSDNGEQIEVTETGPSDTSLFNYQIKNPSGWEVNTTYQLDIETEKFGLLTAQARMPEKPTILNAEWREDTRYDVAQDQEFYVLQMEVDKNGEDFLHFRFMSYDTILNRDIFRYSNVSPSTLRPDDFVFNGNYFLAEVTENDQLLLEIEFPVGAFSGGMPNEHHIIKIYASANSPDYYNLNDAQKRRFDSGGGPFSEPIIFPSNVVGGIGNFSMIHSSEPFDLMEPK